MLRTNRKRGHFDLFITLFDQKIYKNGTKYLSQRTDKILRAYLEEFIAEQKYKILRAYLAAVHS